MAHRCIEWDGWEEGLVDSMLGPEEQEEDWFKEWQDEDAFASHDDGAHRMHGGQPDERVPALVRDGLLAGGAADLSPESDAKPESPVAPISPTLLATVPSDGNSYKASAVAPVPKVVVAVEKEREKLLNATGDFCGGRGGELGRRLEAWLYVNGDEDGRVDLGRRWEGDEDESG